MPQNPSQWLWLLIASTAFVRGALAGALPLGNDEVYYWLYALYPDWSHFDHPPMVGWVIRIFTFNLQVDHEFFIRLGAVLLMAADTWLIYRISLRMADEWTALKAALLFNASAYGSVVVGTFILPDSPQLFFWLLSIYLVCAELEKPKPGLRLLGFGLCAGLAILSKYHGVFLWVGLGLYVLLFKRSWLASPLLYLAAFLSAVVASPIYFWNSRYGFISFVFQGGRVAANQGLRPDYLGTELLGQLFYQNPVCFFLVAAALILFFRQKQLTTLAYSRLLLLIALPLWIVFTGFSLFRSTLPHWTGPAYASLWPFVALQFSYSKTLNRTSWAFVRFALGILAFFVFAAFVYVKFVPFHIGAKTQANLGENDELLDILGWEQVRKGFEEIRQRDLRLSAVSPQAVLLSWKWFPAANIDYYLAKPLGMKLLVYGKLEDVHKYAWINSQRGHLMPGQDAYFLAFSNHPLDIEALWGKHFEIIEKAGVIKVKKAGLWVKTVTVYRLKNCILTPTVKGFDF